MKHTLFTLLAALVASPAFAGNLNPNDWAPLCGDDHQDCHYTFENGNLIAHGGEEYDSYEGCMLLYTSTAPKMENNSSLAITLQFVATPYATPDAITTPHWTGFTIAIPLGSETMNMLQVMKSNAGSIKLMDTFGGTEYTLSEGGKTTADLTHNYTVENGNLCYTYKFNGKTSEKMTAAEGIDTSLAWQPLLAWDWAIPTAFTVTEVTFSMVPEPATATLSLLALAGLAARRRRK